MPAEHLINRGAAKDRPVKDGLAEDMLAESGSAE
jgi:hypothetical protein